MSEYKKTPEALARLTPEQYRVTQQNGTEAPTQNDVPASAIADALTQAGYPTTYQAPKETPAAKAGAGNGAAPVALPNTPVEDDTLRREPPPPDPNALPSTPVPAPATPEPDEDKANEK